VIAVDTNVIVRFLTGDDAVQHSKARKLLAENTVFIPETVVLETEWVLRFAYDYSPKQIREAFSGLFGLPTVVLAHPTLLSQAMEWNARGMDFADALHLVNSQQYEGFFTFDRKLVKKAEGCGVCPVVQP